MAQAPNGNAAQARQSLFSNPMSLFRRDGGASNVDASGNPVQQNQPQNQQRQPQQPGDIMNPANRQNPEC